MFMKNMQTAKIYPLWLVGGAMDEEHVFSHGERVFIPCMELNGLAI